MSVGWIESFKIQGRSSLRINRQTVEQRKGARQTSNSSEEDCRGEKTNHKPLV